MDSIRRIINLCTLLVLTYSSTAVSYEEYLFSTGLIKLIVSPEDYENKLVQVSGYLSEISPSIYLSKQHAELGSSGDSINVIDSTEGGELSNSGCLGRFVHIFGTLKRDSKSNTENYFITDLLSVRTIVDGHEEYCYRKKK